MNTGRRCTGRCAASRPAPARPGDLIEVAPQDLLRRPPNRLCGTGRAPGGDSFADTVQINPLPIFVGAAKPRTWLFAAEAAPTDEGLRCWLNRIGGLFRAENNDGGMNAPV